MLVGVANSDLKTQTADVNIRQAFLAVTSAYFKNMVRGRISQKVIQNTF